jgi:hypothetical protein
MASTAVFRILVMPVAAAIADSDSDSAPETSSLSLDGAEMKPVELSPHRSQI